MFACEASYAKAMRQPRLCVQSNAVRGGVTSLETFLPKMSSSGYPSPIKETWRRPHLRCPCTTSPRDCALDDTWRRPCLMYPHRTCPCPTSPTDLLSEDSLHEDSLLEDILRCPRLRHLTQSHPHLTSLTGTLCLMTSHSMTH